MTSTDEDVEAVVPNVEDNGHLTAISGVHVDVWKEYGAYAFIWQTSRLDLDKSYIQAIKKRLQQLRRIHPALPPWWGSQVELPF